MGKRDPDTMPGEAWAPTDVEGYLVSSFGRVWSTKTSRMRAPGATGRRRDYLFVPLVDAGVRVNRYVHRLVLEAFVGPCPAGHQCAHLDGDPSNNRVANLAWVTPAENNQHKVGHGTQRRGARVVGSKLTEADVVEARAARRRGDRVATIAERFGLDRGAMGLVLRGRRWAHVEGAIGG